MGAAVLAKRRSSSPLRRALEYWSMSMLLLLLSILLIPSDISFYYRL